MESTASAVLFVLGAHEETPLTTKGHKGSTKQKPLNAEVAECGAENDLLEEGF